MVVVGRKRGSDATGLAIDVLRAASSDLVRLYTRTDVPPSNPLAKLSSTADDADDKDDEDGQEDEILAGR